MSDASFMSLTRERLIPILEDTPPNETVIIEKGIPYTAEQVLNVVRSMEPGTMFHIPRPKD